ncbi:nuclear-interacting partner of ALK [Gadus chalcogrammus]|uniref:nuclear-interacting partner of ALK n=1 Tax=Gadus chalcogrammus TaxID=1042646 RepID=UPI0024C4BB71|nr:nuclear-interacting partner of ALK [Gadus chalcogrammus]
MATISSRGVRLGNSNQGMSSFTSPEKVRELLSGGVSSTDQTSINSIQGSLTFVEPSTTPATCVATNEAAFLSRVESFSCLRWAGKPRILSPLKCAQYGWINVGCDMLKCSSCQAFLCASLSPTLDLEKYESRIVEISRQLQSQHEKFCPWPDFPSPERFWLVPASEPTALLSSFLARFQSACLLEQQLPAMKPEHLKSMSLTEDVISILLQLIEGEQKKRGLAHSTDALAIQVAACIVSLCGWAASPALKAMSLPILTCSFCMRKVGLWNFHQMEGTVTEDEAFYSSPSPTPTPTHAPGQLLGAAVAQEGQGDQSVTSSPASTPRRMGLRSQDTSRSDQVESPLSATLLRSRSKDSPGPNEEPQCPLPKGKRHASGRGRGSEGAASPVNTPKRVRLSSAGGPDGPLQKNVFDPLAQHRDWCPWVNVVKEDTNRGAIPLLQEDSVLHQQGWKAALDLLVPMKKNSNPSKGSPAQCPQDKSKRVFAIFRQWQVSTPSQ